MERLELPERVPALTDAQEITLQILCQRYGVEYSPEHYIVSPLDGWAEGWLGGRCHANPEYAEPEEPVGKPTIYIGVSPEGESHS